MNKREKGSQMEQAAASFLQKHGYEVLCLNYRCHLGEIDIICKEDDRIVFVEVKYRSNDNYGTPFEAVDSRKQAKIRSTALCYLKENGYSTESNIRFDVVGITKISEEKYYIKVIKEAF